MHTHTTLPLQKPTTSLAFLRERRKCQSCFGFLVSWTNNNLADLFVVLWLVLSILSLSPRTAEILAELALSLRAPVGRLPAPLRAVRWFVSTAWDFGYSVTLLLPSVKSWIVLLWQFRLHYLFFSFGEYLVIVLWEFLYFGRRWG